ncbi:unnamed protein product [Dovyalis caffra]|uniref:Uncharacterized protein n=1 Tax=Dovyalis caffra TaxID=77055 RepID=A0AAV1RKN1_9ROSI|nr:unnamed protein product [Dovyalis caffra]
MCLHLQQLQLPDVNDYYCDVYFVTFKAQDKRGKIKTYQARVTFLDDTNSSDDDCIVIDYETGIVIDHETGEYYSDGYRKFNGFDVSLPKPPSTYEGPPAIEFSFTELQQSSKIFEFSSIATFSRGRFPINTIRAHIQTHRAME